MVCPICKSIKTNIEDSHDESDGDRTEVWGCRSCKEFFTVSYSLEIESVTYDKDDEPCELTSEQYGKIYNEVNCNENK